MKLTDEQRQLVEENMRLVSFAVNKMRFSITRASLSFDDARQAGYEGLCKAATRWDADRSKLSTYAMLYIRGQILKACAESNLMGAGRGVISRHPELWDAAVSLDALLGNSDSLTLGDLLPATNDTEAHIDVVDIWNQFNAREQCILSGVLNGRKRKEIAKATGVSPQAISDATKRIKLKTMDYLAQCKA